MNTNYYKEGISDQKVDTIWRQYYDGIEFNVDSCRKTMNQMILDSKAYRPNSTALTYFNKKITKQQLQDKIREAAIAYRNMGIKDGDTIYIFELNTPETVISIYALNSIGAVPEYFNMIGVTPDKLKKDINKYNIKFMLTTDIFYDAYKNIINETCCEKVIVNSLRDSFDKLTDFLYMTQLIALDKAVALGNKKEFQKFKKLVEKLKKLEKYTIDTKSDKKYSFHKKRLENEKIITWSEFISTYYRDEIFVPAKYQDRKVTSIFHTGGTTGMYKYIGATDCNLNANILMMALSANNLTMLSSNTLKIDKNDKYLIVVPPMVSYGIVGIHFSQYMNINSILIPRYDKDEFVDLLLKYKANHTFVVPAFAKTLINNPKLKGKDLSFIHSITHGGEGITADEDRSIDEVLISHGAGPVSFHGFGQNELCGGATININMNGKEKKYGTCGYPFMGCKIAILDPLTKKVLGKGLDENGNIKSGSLYIAGATVSIGYIREDAARNIEKRLILDGEEYFETGDMAHLDEDGRLWYDTRLERIIRIEGGNKVFATPLENQIKLIEEIKDILVIKVITENNTPQLSYQIVLQDDLNNLPEIQRLKVINDVLIKIESKVLEEFNEFYLPTSYKFHKKDLDLTPFGKVDFIKLEKDEQDYYNYVQSNHKEYKKIR